MIAGVLAPALACTWLHRPFLGAFFEQTNVYNAVLPTPGGQWALTSVFPAYGYRLTAVDGTPITTSDDLRAAMPDLAIRTTFIVGYPGETEEEFQALLDFALELKFDRVGCFTFSYEPGTASAARGDPIPEEVKEERRARLMEQQQRISLERNQAQVGKTLDVLIEGEGDGLSLGRSYRDAP